MRIPRLYLPEDFSVGATLPLSREQSHYALTVLRLKNQHPLELFDGKGNIATGTLAVLGRKEAQVTLSSVTKADNESPLQSILIQGISRGDRMDYSIQKTVELGITAIQPVFTERCEVKLKGDKLEKRREQWQSIAINACEQSGRAWVPQILPLITLDEFWQAHPQIQGVTGDPYASDSLKNLTPPDMTQPLHILVGPEGGLSEAEVTKAIAHGCRAIQLGPRILRTETAGPAILTLSQSLWGDL